MNYILASQSPRRREILENLGVEFRVVIADTDESCEEKDPCRLVEILARRKGEAVLGALKAAGEDLSDTVIIASDTVVAAEGEILGKPRDAADAARMLRMLEGKRHRVISGVFLMGGCASGTDHEVTEVEFDPLSEEEIQAYICATNPYDKAGAYAIQGKASAFIKGIHGCYFNVVGLPVHCLNALHRRLFGKNLI
jgi:septum formation protein